MIFISKTLYDNSLGIALVLMLFFAAYFLVAKVPDKRIFANYLRSRRLMAGALLMLSANYSVHLLIAPPARPRTLVWRISQRAESLSQLHLNPSKGI